MRTIQACTGRIVVTGIGKSGHIARKIAATLASTGTPAFFVHFAEASHGDLGMIQGRCAAHGDGGRIAERGAPRNEPQTARHDRIVNHDGTLAGLYTDGDLRRTLEKGIDIRTAAVTDVMTRDPHTIEADKLAAEALQYMEKFRINGLLALDERGRVVGAFNLHDLFRAGVV